MSTGSQKVRLLTFREFPECTNSVELPGFRDAVAHLSAGSVLFENHYLQAVGPGGVFGTSELELLERMVTDSGRKVSVVFHGESSAFEEFRSAIPAWIDLQFVSAEQACIRDGISPDKLVTLQESDFVWLHCDVSAATAETDMEFTSVFNGQIEFCQQLDSHSHSHGDGDGAALLLITSLNGIPEADLPEFESLLFEGLVRVPLWATGFPVPPRRIQTISGSFDLGVTVLHCLRSGAVSRDDAAGKSILDSGELPLDLRQLCLSSDPGGSRALRIRTLHATALRTHEFLFVHAASAETGEDGDVALYAKPRDVWNLNDVSSQYMELVQEFALRLN